jgi:DNA-binding XRE family transcriptional regulator
MKRITKEAFRAHRKKMGISQQAMANVLGVCLSTIRNWEQEKSGKEIPYHWALDPRLEHLATDKIPNEEPF